MAQPDHYVQSDCSALDHPKTFALAQALKCHEIAAFGAIVALRCRAMRHCPSGDVSAISERTLKLWLLGFPRVSWAAFVGAGIVDQEGERRTMHGWERYAAKETKRRLAADRQKRVRDKRVTGVISHASSHASVTRDASVTSHESHATEGEEEGEGEKEGKGNRSEITNVGECSGTPPQAPPALASLPSFFEKIFRGKSARTNNLRRSDELRTTLGEGLSRYAERVAEAIAVRAERSTNCESYVTSAVRQPWVREIAARLEAHDAEERERASRAPDGPAKPRAGGAGALKLDELLALIPGGGA